MANLADKKLGRNIQDVCHFAIEKLLRDDSLKWTITTRFKKTILQNYFVGNINDVEILICHKSHKILCFLDSLDFFEIMQVNIFSEILSPILYKILNP